MSKTPHLNHPRPKHGTGRQTLLYLDTSEPEAVLRVYRDGKVLAEKKWPAHRELSATLSQNYSDILANMGIDGGELVGVIVFVGPGSFTGLRIGISFANALAYGLSIPVYETRERESFDLSSPKKVAAPFYGSDPHITKPKH